MTDIVNKYIFRQINPSATLLIVIASNCIEALSILKNRVVSPQDFELIKIDSDIEWRKELLLE